MGPEPSTNPEKGVRPLSEGRGWIDGAIACVVVGASFPVSAALEDFPAAYGQAGRYLLGALILTVLLRGRLKRPTLRELVILTGVAAVGMAGFNLLLLAAVERIGGANTGVVVGASPILLALLAPLLARRAPTASIIASATVVTVGAALVTGIGGDGPDPLGLLLAGGALLGEVGFTLLAAPILPRLGPMNLAAWGAYLAAGQLLALGLATEQPQLPTATELAALLYLAICTTALAFVFWFRAMERLEPERVGLLVGLMPVAAVATQSVIDASLPSVLDVAGTALVMLGVALGQRASRRPVQQAAV